MAATAAPAAALVRLAAIVFGAIALGTLAIDLLSLPIRLLGDDILAGRRFDAPPTTVARDARPLWRTCRRDIILAHGQIAGATLDAVIAAGDVAGVPAAVSDLERAARDLLSCSPAEGMGWGWLATARDEQGAPTAEVLDLFERSIRRAPVEMWILTFRLQQATRIRSRRGAAFDDVVRHDVRILFDDDIRPGLAAAALAPVFPWLDDIARQEARRIDDPQRLRRLAAELGRNDYDLLGCSKGAFADWLYRGRVGTCEDADRRPDFDWRRDLVLPPGP